MYYGFENIIDLDVTWNQYHIQRYFNSDLTIISKKETLIFQADNYIQTIFLWSSVRPLIVCVNQNSVKMVRYCCEWVENIIPHHFAVVNRSIYFLPLSHQDRIIDDNGYSLSRFTYTAENYKLSLCGSKMSYQSNKQNLLEAQIDQMYVCDKPSLGGWYIVSAKGELVLFYIW